MLSTYCSTQCGERELEKSEKSPSGPVFRIASSTQTTPTTGGTAYTFKYGYSLTDQLTCLTYPSGRQVNYLLDAADRVEAVQNMTTGTASPCQTVQSSYATINYTAPGGISSMTLGNGVVQQPSWNGRLQAVGLQASKSGNSLLALGLYPCANSLTSCASGNNGNLQSQTITVPGLSTLTQSYAYDSLNRLTGITENGTALENYGYDGSGNLWVSYHSSSLAPLTAETPQASSWYSGTANRITGWTYDLDGNVTGIQGMNRTFTYDGENLQVSATIGNSTSTYAYDGNGLRVSATVNGQTTTYVYDAFGNLAAEYGQSELSPCGTPTCYVTWDHLGSTRMLTDSSGNAQRRYDFLPFGPEIPAGVDGRSTGYLSSPDDTNPKFTGQMRDADTTLDFFNVRYLSPAQGRFQSPDPGNAGADPADPQTWNAYAYVENNPLTYTDPSGMGGEGIALGLGCGPVCGGVIAGIETGIEIWRLFGHLGYSGPPVPNWAGTAWQLGPAQPQDQPWSEQNPYASGSGGSFNIGGVFGSGNTDPFVFSFQDSSGGWLANAPTIPGWIVNGVAGAGDKFSFGLTAVIRKHTPGGDATDTNTRSYMVGGWVGTGYQIVFGAALGGTAAAVADGKYGAIFGRGGKALLNKGPIRFGWYWTGTRDAIGLRIFSAPNSLHIPFFFPNVP